MCYRRTGWLLFLVCLLIFPALVYAQAACTHYVSQGGAGSGSCTVGTPCNLGRFWALAAPGSVACLNDGTYTDTIVPPSDLAGTSGNPITIRALNDGQVTIDAQHGGFAVWLSGTGGSANDWFVIEGINAKNGIEAVYRVSGANNILRRVIGWDGTSGEADSNIYHITGTNNLVEDCAGWGMNSRKIFDAAQGNNIGGGGFMRCWGEWNDHPQGVSQPNNTWLISYNTGNARFFNNIGTWRQLGDIGNAESIMEIARNCDEPNFDAEGTLVGGMLMYITPGFTYSPEEIVHGFCASDFTMTDVLAFVPSGFSTKKPFVFDRGSSGQPSGSVCNNCLGVHNGTASSNSGDSGWTLNNFHEGSSLAAATGGTNVFSLLPGLCYRYTQSGTLTGTPLWPWPMNQRILDARSASGFTAVDVQATVEGMLGTIPTECLSGGADTTPPSVAITAPTNGATVSGTTVAVTADASDNVGVVGVQFKLDGSNLDVEETTAPYAITWDTTGYSDGSHALTAVARDFATNDTTSSTVTVTINNSGVSGVWYVSTTGSDSNAGTSAGAAWATLQHAHDTAASGDTIHVLAGQYYQRVSITKSNMTWTGEVGTIVDGSDALTGWASQGNGVYRVATPGYAPGALTALPEKLTLHKYSDALMGGDTGCCACDTGLNILAFAANATCEGRLYWDGWEGAFGVTGGFVYARFRNGENPNSMAVRSCPDTGTFTIDGGASNIIEQMNIGGCANAVKITNSADTNIIRNNTLRNGYQQVMIQGGTGNQIIDNIIRTQMLGDTAGYAAHPVLGGNWRPGATDLDAKLNIYHHSKFEVDDSGSEKTGGIIMQGANSVTIDGNDIQGGTAGVNMESGGTGSIIRNNYVAHQSAECLYYSEYGTLEIAHNVLVDGEHLIRIQGMEYGGKTGYIYRNHFHQDLDGAKHIHFSFITRAQSTNVLYIYHNTFTGAGWCCDLGGGDAGSPPTTMAGVRILDNVLSGDGMDITSSGGNCNTGADGFYGMWAYNHCSNGCSMGGSSGDCVSNTTGGVSPIWAAPLTDVLLPPAGHAAENSAIRLDQDWTINSTTRSALPGMAGGYYPDATPNRGSWQIDELATEPPQANIGADGQVKPGHKVGRYGGFRIHEQDACDGDCLYQRWLQEREQRRKLPESYVGVGF